MNDSLKVNSLPHAISIVLFSRFPEPGKTKTRLAWSVGDNAAANIHRHMLNSILTTLVNHTANVNIILNYTGADCEQSMRKALYSSIDTKSIHFIKQPDLSFGERVNAIARRLHKVIIVSSDIPQLSIEQINQTIAHLENNQSVIGLTEDGGYYLIGLPEYRDVFTSIDYRADNVGQQTFSLMQQYFSHAYLLKEKLIDVDEKQDLEALGLAYLVEDSSSVEDSITISVIIPVLNESDTIIRTLERTISTADEIDSVEIIIVDGHSHDNTVELVKNFKERFPGLKLLLFVISSLGRSFQMNYGFRRSSGHFSLFCHADTLLPKHWDSNIKASFCEANIKWCNFQLRYDNPQRALRFIAWVANNMRRIPYGDQALCFRRDYFIERGKFDYLTLFEDARFMYMTVPSYNGKSLADSVLTSARMYANKQGKLTYTSIFKTVFRNNAMLISAWLLKIPPCLLKSIYYRHFNELNIIEVECFNQCYAFQYHYPQKLRHKMRIWKSLYYQHAMDKVISEILKHIEGNDIIVDAGANAGILSILLALTLTKQQINSDIIAFEPNKRLHKTFQYNQSLYQQEIKNRITLESSMLSSRSEQNYSHFNKQTDTISTQTLALDDYSFEDKPISVVTINFTGTIDAERHELDVLQGMKTILHRHKPVVFFALLSRSVKRLLDCSTKNEQKNTINDFFDRMGYRVEKISGMGYVAYPKS